MCDIFSLTKDMTGKEDVYRGPAIRALCRITDVSAASACFPCPVAPSLPSHCHLMLYILYIHI